MTLFEFGRLESRLQSSLLQLSRENPLMDCKFDLVTPTECGVLQLSFAWMTPIELRGVFYMRLNDLIEFGRLQLSHERTLMDGVFDLVTQPRVEYSY